MRHHSCPLANSTSSDVSESEHVVPGPLHVEPVLAHVRAKVCTEGGSFDCQAAARGKPSVSEICCGKRTLQSVRMQFSNSNQTSDPHIQPESHRTQYPLPTWLGRLHIKSPYQAPPASSTIELFFLTRQRGGCAGSSTSASEAPSSAGRSWNCRTFVAHQRLPSSVRTR